MKPVISLFCLLAAPAWAEVMVPPADFRDYAEGFTVYFEHEGAPFGAERFEPGGAVTWEAGDGTCADGVWRPHGAQVCFYYGTGPVQCWRVFRDDAGMFARLLTEGENQGMELRITRRDTRPLACSGAALGT